MISLDALDRKILNALQQDASLSLEALAKQVGSSKTPVWNRVRKLKASGVIQREAALLAPEAVGFGTCFFVLVRTSQHEEAWLEAFAGALLKRPEVMEAHRLAGDVDYILKVRVADVAAYNRFYRDLVAEVSIFEVTSLLSMEALVERTALAL